jgi:exosome complex exonuclease RRP6
VSSTPISKKKNDSEVIVVSALEDRPKKVKRKRTTVPAIEGEEGGVVESSASKKESTKKRSKLTPPVVSEPLEPHDYSLAPSLLDAPSTSSLNAVAGISKERKRKDKKDKLAKGFATVEGDKGGFGRAPRVNNAPKKGNLAMSFLK